MYTSYQLTQTARKQLLAVFPPKYEKVIAHHVTHTFGVLRGTPTPQPANIKVVGYTNNSNGIEALIVSVDGDITRPDGSVFHITWSLDPDIFKPVAASELARQRKHKLVMPISVATNPAISN